jgi:probable AcnD-accessory protein PrpF
VIISPSTQPSHDVDYLYGQVPINDTFIDWSSNCGNLSSAVGPFAIANNLVSPSRVPHDGICTVRIWQANIGKTIVAHVPVANGEVQEIGDFELDGVNFPAAEISLEFIDPADEGEGGVAMFPTGNVVDDLDVPGMGHFKSTMINAGVPVIFLEAAALGYDGTELQAAINEDKVALANLETIRLHAAVNMGLAKDIEQAAKQPLMPKLVFVAPPKDYKSSSDKPVHAADIDLLVRAMSMGKLHHAMMGTASVAIAAAVAIPGTVVNAAAGGGVRALVCFGHPSGTMRVGADVKHVDGKWLVSKAVMSRSARVLMEGAVRVPLDCGYVSEDQR